MKKVILSELREGDTFSSKGKKYTVEGFTHNSFVVKDGEEVYFNEIDQLPEHGSEYDLTLDNALLKITVLMITNENRKLPTTVVFRVDARESELLSIPLSEFESNSELTKSVGVCSCVGFQHHIECPLHEICY